MYAVFLVFWFLRKTHYGPPRKVVVQIYPDPHLIREVTVDGKPGVGRCVQTCPQGLYLKIRVCFHHVSQISRYIQIRELESLRSGHPSSTQENPTRLHTEITNADSLPVTYQPHQRLIGPNCIWCRSIYFWKNTRTASLFQEMRLDLQFHRGRREEKKKQKRNAFPRGGTRVSIKREGYNSHPPLSPNTTHVH